MILSGRILNIEHIQKPSSPIEEWLRKSHTAEEVAQRLRLRDSSQFDTNDLSKEFSPKEIEDMKIVKRNPITMFNTDKLYRIGEQFDKMAEFEDEKISF